MNCTPKVRQKKSNFWGAVHKNLDNMRFIVERFTSFLLKLSLYPSYIVDKKSLQNG